MFYSDHYPFENWPLPYADGALAPYIEEETVHVHHDLNSQAYVNNLNRLLEDHPPLQQLTLEELIRAAHRMRVSSGRPILRNAGGVFNHRLYFDVLQPPAPASAPSDMLLEAIETGFGDLGELLARLKAVALSVFGSGYGWLVANKDGELAMLTTVNQETPLPLNLCPLLAVDVWEHAYYLGHYNNRGAYLDNLFQLFNWDLIGRRFADFVAGLPVEPEPELILY